MRDPDLLKQLHHELEECALCGAVDFSLHHVLKRSQGGDDVRENIVALCGSGTTGCHGLVEASDDATCRYFGTYLLSARPDTVAYLGLKLGGPEPAAAWLQRHLLRVPS